MTLLSFLSLHFERKVYNKNEPCVIYFLERGAQMPKVTLEYFDNKKLSILDAALAVCKKKPLHQITMKDVIRESGISQGGIYRYYKNIDEILVDVMNKSFSNIDFRQMVNNVIINSKNSSEAVKNLICLLAEYMNDNATTLGKFQFELTQLVAYKPDRINSISAQNRHVENTQYFMNQLFEVIRNGVSKKDFQPVIPLNDIICFISTSIDGIILDGVLHKCYGLPEREYGFDILRLMNTVAQSVINLLSPDKLYTGKYNYMKGEQQNAEK